LLLLAGLSVKILLLLAGLSVRILLLLAGLSVKIFETKLGTLMEPARHTAAY
jgi:hypothetical protein